MEAFSRWRCLVPYGKILLVEDNPDDEALALRALQGHGLTAEVLVARDGEQALRMLLPGPGSGGGEMPSVVLLDLKLPGIDGLTVLERIRGDERTQLLPVVILTTSDEPNDILDSYRRGANSFVRKPVDFARFTEALRTLGCYWLTINTTPKRRE
jgi:CheY-like chemotaxis protein